jgi:hypothetical protein
MRTLALALALGLFAVSTNAVAACTGMQTAQKDQVVASSSNGKAQSTPIPARQGGNS